MAIQNKILKWVKMLVNKKNKISAPLSTSIEEAIQIDYYIEPQFELFDSLETLLESKPSSFPSYSFAFDESIESFSFQSFFDTTTRAFIIADPGYGKSKLLQQICKSANKEIEQAKLIELRTLDSPSEIGELETEGCNIFCFDALDEVRHDHYNGVVNQLRNFCKKNPDKSIFISCRKHDAANHKFSLKGFKGLKFVQIAPFHYADIKRFVEESGIQDDSLIGAMIEKSRPRNGSFSILSVPRYLKTLTDLVKIGNVNAEEIQLWKRKDFFERFIYTRLDAATSIKEGLYLNEKEITKRVLEKMSLIMEIYQVNAITKDEFISFLDGIDSNINLVFFNTCDIDTFLDRVMQPRKEKEIEWLEFHHTEFQEFLAAKELDRLASSGQVIYDFVVQPEFKKIYPNWYDVLRYLVEINPKHIFPLLEFLRQQKEGWVENAFWGLLAGIDPEDLSPKERAIIFDRVFNYVQETPGVWVVHHLVNLGVFFEKENYHHIENIPENLAEKDGQRRLYNQIDILEDVLLKLGDTEKQNFRQKYKGLVDRHEVLKVKKITLAGLIYTGEIQDLVDLKHIFDNGDELVRNAFTYACHRLDPNNPFSIQIFLEGLKDADNRDAIEGINAIQNKDQITSVLKSFIGDVTLIDLYLKGIDKYLPTNQFGIFDNTKKCWDADLENLLFELFKLTTQDIIQPNYKKEEFEIKLVHVLIEMKLETLIRMVQDVPDLWRFLYQNGNTIKEYLTLEYTDAFIEACLNKEENIDRELVHHVFWKLFIQNAKEQNPVYTKAKQYFTEILELYENPPDRSESEAEYKEIRNQKRYEHFQELLEPEPDKINFRVFKHMLDNIEIILELASEEEIERVKEFLRRILPIIDSSKVNVEIIDQEKGMTYRTSTHIFYFSTYLQLAKSLKILDEITIPREHLIGYLPLIQEDASGVFKEAVILELIGEMTREDISYVKHLIESRRGSDFLRFAPVKIAEIAQRYEIISLVPVLEELVTDEKIPIYNQIKILGILTIINPNQAFLKQLSGWYFYEENADLRRMGMFANEKLIEVFDDDEAIELRFSFIKEKLVHKYEEPKTSDNKGRWFSGWEEEMHYQRIPKVLIDKRMKKLIPRFQDLLEYAFGLIKKDRAYKKYVDYLFNTVYHYYLGIKEEASYSSLRELFVFIDSKFPEQKSFFSQYRTRLEIEYIQIHDKPSSIQPCINKYNEIKKRSYLPIYDVQDLLFLIQQIIEEDIRKKFVQHQGFYNVVDKNFIVGRGRKMKDGRVLLGNIREDYVQKTLKIQIENALLMRGFREIDIIREPQLMDDKRIDLLVKYGFIQPIVIELKLLHNPEITRPKERIKYKPKLHKYMFSQGASHCIYLIFKVKKVRNHDKHFHALREEYKDMEGIVIPDFVDCTP